MAQETATKEKVSIPRTEYDRLKKLDKQFGKFLIYAEHLLKIRAARGEVVKKKVISQEKLFRRFGL